MATGTRHLALLRGINVGGKNLVKMADLRGAFEGMGFGEVSTFIASGNVLFRAPRQRRAELAARVEKELTSRFGTELRVVILSDSQLRRVVDEAPRGFGSPDLRCDVIFLRKPLTVAKALAVAETREGVDRSGRDPVSSTSHGSRRRPPAAGSRRS